MHCTDCGARHCHSGRRCEACNAAATEALALLLALLSLDSTKPLATRQAAARTAERMGVRL